MIEICCASKSEHHLGTKMQIVAAEGENVLSSGNFTLTLSAFGDGRIPTLLAGGISTPLHNRRGGNVRKMFQHMHASAADEGVAVALLHPFSFSYYRKFGYEKVADHVILRCPTRLIDFVPRRCSFVPLTEDHLPDLAEIYGRFSKGRNLLLPRNRIPTYGGKTSKGYIFYENGSPAAYIIYTTEQRLEINHLTDGVVTVHEMAYTSPSALREIFSFLRMFEGEMEEIRFANLAPCPEAELMLRHYTHTEYRLLPDLMARVLNTEKLLLAHTYPEEAGAFTVEVLDELPTICGKWRVEYSGGVGCVRRLPEGERPDVTMTAAAFVRAVYGYDGFDSRVAAYADGVEVNNMKTTFFSVFSRRPGGIFEHF